MKKAEFTEYGKLFTGFMAVVLVLIQWSYFSQAGSKPLTLAPYLILTLLFFILLAAFFKLTIRVDSGKIRFVYGLGFIKITKHIDQIISIEELKTPWYWGLGIRMTPNGWLYNIQSRETLDITYSTNSKENRILVGSKDRSGLREVLESKSRIDD